MDQMGILPDRQWLLTFADVSRASLPSCTGQALATLAGAMGRLWEKVGKLSGRRSEVVSDGAGSSALGSAYASQPDPAAAAWALSLLQISQRRLEAVSKRAAAVPGGGSWKDKLALNSDDLVCLGLALPSLLLMLKSCGGGQANIVSSSPPHSQDSDRERWSSEHQQDVCEWLQSLKEATLSQLPAFTPSQLAKSILALARIQRLQDGKASLRSTPGIGMLETDVLDTPWLRTWLRASARSASSFNAADTAQSLWSLAALRVTCSESISGEIDSCPHNIFAPMMRDPIFQLPPLQSLRTFHLPLSSKRLLSGSAISCLRHGAVCPRWTPGSSR